MPKPAPPKLEDWAKIEADVLDLLQHKATKDERNLVVVDHLAAANVARMFWSTL